MYQSLAGPIHPRVLVPGTRVQRTRTKRIEEISTANSNESNRGNRGCFSSFYIYIFSWSYLRSVLVLRLPTHRPPCVHALQVLLFVPNKNAPLLPLLYDSLRVRYPSSLSLVSSPRLFQFLFRRLYVIRVDRRWALYVGFVPIRRRDCIYFFRTLLW